MGDFETTPTLASFTTEMFPLNTTDSMSGSNSTLEQVYLESYTPLVRFSRWYEGVHGYLSLVICLFGIVSNIMNIMVLTQKNMVTPTNYLLTALAISDLLTMTAYVPNAIYFYCISKPHIRQKHPYGWIIYLIGLTQFIITMHTIAMWLTVSLAVFRYILVCHHTLGPRLCNFYRTKITILAVFITTILFCTPNYLIYHPIPVPGGYWLDKRPFVTPFLLVFSYWLYGVVLKVAPCVLLTVLSALLIWAMRIANHKRKRLKIQGKRAESERASEHNRTTGMLVAVVLCFVIAELPQGILAFLSGVDNKIFNEIYIPLGDLFDMLVLINSSVNFLLYCTMSRQFRETFKSLFIDSWTKRPTKEQNGVHYSTIDTQTTKM